MLSHESVMPIKPSHSIIVCFENRWTRYKLSSVISVFVLDVLSVALKFRIVWNSGYAVSENTTFCPLYDASYPSIRVGIPVLPPEVSVLQLALCDELSSPCICTICMPRIEGAYW